MSTITNNKIKLTKEQVILLEKLMVVQEKSGMAPALAKVISLLLISDEPELTFDEIKDTLGISKSATSTAINQLLTAQRIEYKSRLGDRRRYFRSRIDSWQESVRNNIDGLASFGTLLQDVLDQRPNETKDFNNNLKRLIAFMDYLQKQMPILLNNFEKTLV